MLPLPSISKSNAPAQHASARALLLLALLAGLCAGLGGPSLLAGAAQSRYASLDVVISEVAWAGTEASADDEWLELYNPGPLPIDFDADPGWRLLADDGSPDILLSGAIAAPGFFLLERASEKVTNLPADMIYFGSLEDGGETLRLRAPDGFIVDTANADGGAWPAGSLVPTGSMERYGPTVQADSDFAWATNAPPDGLSSGSDAAGNPIHGTPRLSNWAFTVAATFTPDPTETPTVVPHLTVIINEVGWMGTLASSTDEWIELHNPTTAAFSLSGWHLRAADGTPTIDLSGIIPAGGFFLIATNDSLFVDEDPLTIDVVPGVTVPGQTFSGTLANEGEVLRLYDPRNAVVDTANSDSGAWPAGSAAPNYASMERRLATTDGFFAWSTYSNPANTQTPVPPPYPDPVVHDRNGNRIKGTPGQANWGVTVTQTPTSTITPTRTITPTLTATRRPTSTAYLSRLVLINEYLPRPGHDWNNDGAIDVYDEFIEIINVDSVDINLGGWKLDDGQNEGSASFTLPDRTLKPGQRAVFYALETNILLSDGGDRVRLIRPNNQVADDQSYPFARLPDESRCRLPENYLGRWYGACFPTPGSANALAGATPVPPSAAVSRLAAPVCLLPDTLAADFRMAECNAYGSEMWSAWYWDRTGWQGDQYVPEQTTKWQSFVE